MKTPTIAIIDYGAGNIRSVAKAFEKIGYPARVTASPHDVLAADAVILPGVGAAGDTMSSLSALGMVDALQQVFVDNRPFFGVCLGLQLLFETTEEGGAECLGLLPGDVRLLPSSVKVPHIGWNQVRVLRHHPIFEGIEDGSFFYFVHSYYAHPSQRELIAADTEYGSLFCSAVTKGNMVATQFHPEKSGARGLRIYANFARRIVPS